MSDHMHTRSQPVEGPADRTPARAPTRQTGREEPGGPPEITGPATGTSTCLCDISHCLFSLGQPYARIHVRTGWDLQSMSPWRQEGSLRELSCPGRRLAQEEHPWSQKELLQAEYQAARGKSPWSQKSSPHLK